MTWVQFGSANWWVLMVCIILGALALLGLILVWGHFIVKHHSEKREQKRATARVSTYSKVSVYGHRRR